jgi:hypothetical protein
MSADRQAKCLYLRGFSALSAAWAERAGDPAGPEMRRREPLEMGRKERREQS